MPPVPAAGVDLSKVDPNRILMNREQLLRVLPHRHEMVMIDGVLHLDRQASEIVGFRDVRADEFWARGHFPGNPMMPGVLVVEAAAQLAVIGYKLMVPEVQDRLVAFGGIDEVRFRGIIRPGQRLTLACRGLSVRPRALKSRAWGFVDGQEVFEGVVLGVPIQS